jgi:hypothetical protein
LVIGPVHEGGSSVGGHEYSTGTLLAKWFVFDSDSPATASDGRQCRKPNAYHRDLEDIAAGDLLLLLGLRELLIVAHR